MFGSASSQTALDKHNLIAVWRLTALWGFSEAAFGGLLHAFKIPFKGVFIGGAAVLFISLIAYYSTNRSNILKAAVTVILIKALVSPHSPVNAYIAVALQGLFGQLFFTSKKYFKLSALLLGITAVMASSIQRIIVLTIIFGNTFWESIDLFAEFVSREFFSSQDIFNNIKLSYLLIGLYLFIHLILGIIIGIMAGRLPGWINEIDASEHKNAELITTLSNVNIPEKKKKSRWLKPSGIILLIFLLFILWVTYAYPALSENNLMDIIIMIVRSILIIFIWYAFVSPLLTKFLVRVLNKKKNIYNSRIQDSISMFPQFRALLAFTWKKSREYKTFGRIKYFLSHSFFLLLTSNLEKK